MSAASSPVPTRLKQRQHRWEGVGEGVGSSEGPVLPVPDARGCVSCQRHHLLPGSSLGAVLPTPPQRDFRFPLLCNHPPGTGSPAEGDRGSRRPLDTWGCGSLCLALIPFSLQSSSACLGTRVGLPVWAAALAKVSGQQVRPPACPPRGLRARLPAAPQSERGTAIFGAATQDVILAASSPPPPPPPLACSVFLSPPPSQVIKNSACGVKFLTL